MLQRLLLTIISIGLVSQASAQHLWYENETDTDKIILATSQNGTFTTDVNNPSTTGNSNTVVSQFIREADESKGFTYFRLLEPVLTAENYSVTLKAYIDIPTEALTSQNSRIRLYLEASSGVGTVAYEQLKFTQGQTWEEFTFTFDTADFDEEVFAAGGYDQMTIGYGNGSYSATEIAYYVDSIYGWTELSVELALNNVDWMIGSWGVRLNMDGGEKLNASIEDGYDYVEGAKQIVAN